MRKEQKVEVVKELVELIGEYPNFYLTNIEGLTADVTSKLRRQCFGKDIKLMMVKNTLLRIALEEIDAEAFEPLFEYLTGNTAIMFAEVPNAPARLIKDFTKENKPKKEGVTAKPELKAAYVQEELYLGADQLETLATVKSKEELIADIVAALEGSIQSVVSQLSSGGDTIYRLLETLEERSA